MGWPSRRQLTLTWLVTAVALVAVLVTERARSSGLDDADAGRQRPGLLTVAGSAPPAPPALRQALPTGGVVFFERAGRSAALCTALAGAPFRDRAALLTTTEAPSECAGVKIVAVPMDVSRTAEDTAAAVGLPRPRDGGAPVGYAILDGAGRVRYATLDPAAADHIPEVQTMLRAAV